MQNHIAPPLLAYILAYEVYNAMVAKAAPELSEAYDAAVPKGYTLHTPGGLTYWQATRTQYPDLIDATGEAQSLSTPAMQADYLSHLINQLDTLMVKPLNFRKHDLSPLLTPEVIAGVSAKLASQGYASSEAIIRQLAADCTSSNHLKDIIWAELQTRLQQGVAETYLQQQAANTPQTQDPPAPQRRKK